MPPRAVLPGMGKDNDCWLLVMCTEWLTELSWQQAQCKLALLSQITKQIETQTSGFKMRSSECTINWERVFRLC